MEGFPCRVEQPKEIKKNNQSLERWGIHEVPTVMEISQEEKKIRDQEIFDIMVTTESARKANIPEGMLDLMEKIEQFAKKYPDVGEFVRKKSFDLLRNKERK